MWKIEWTCWSGKIEALAHPKPKNGKLNYGLNAAVIAIWENDFGTNIVLDTPENRAALEEAARLGLGRNGLDWENTLGIYGTVTTDTHVRVPTDLS